MFKGSVGIFFDYHMILQYIDIESNKWTFVDYSSFDPKSLGVGRNCPG